MGAPRRGAPRPALRGVPGPNGSGSAREGGAMVGAASGLGGSIPSFPGTSSAVTRAWTGRAPATAEERSAGVAAPTGPVPGPAPGDRSAGALPPAGEPAGQDNNQHPLPRFGPGRWPGILGPRPGQERPARPAQPIADEEPSQEHEDTGPAAGPTGVSQTNEPGQPDESDEPEDPGAAARPRGMDGEPLSDAEMRQVQHLRARDAEVRRHERAHIAAAAGHARGGPHYDLAQGPDGRMYAVGGDVSIDSSTERTPEQTIRKMRVVRRAALAPAKPSTQDRRVAAAASRKELRAQQELRAEHMEEAREEREAGPWTAVALGVAEGPAAWAAPASAANRGRGHELGLSLQRRQAAAAAYTSGPTIPPPPAAGVTAAGGPAIEGLIGNALNLLA